MAEVLQPRIMPIAKFNALIAHDSAKYHKPVKAIGTKVDCGRCDGQGHAVSADRLVPGASLAGAGSRT